LEVVHCFKFPTNEGLRLAYATAAGLPCVLSGIACRRECRRQARSSCRRRNQIAVDASLLEGAKLIQPSFCSASVTRRTNRTARRRHERYGRDQRGESRSVGTRPRLPPTPLQWTSRSTAALRAGRVPGADSWPRFDSLFRMWGLDAHETAVAREQLACVDPLPRQRQCNRRTDIRSCWSRRRCHVGCAPGSFGPSLSSRLALKLLDSVRFDTFSAPARVTAVTHSRCPRGSLPSASFTSIVPRHACR